MQKTLILGVRLTLGEQFAVEEALGNRVRPQEQQGQLAAGPPARLPGGWRAAAVAQVT